MRYDADRGYGFIKPDHGGPDLFMHVSELVRGIDPQQLRQGTRVSYEESDNGRGPKAVRVTVLDGSPVLASHAVTATVIDEQAAQAIWREASQAGYEEFIRVLHERGWL
jgi:cold shock CspA family protein